MFTPSKLNCSCFPKLLIKGVRVTLPGLYLLPLGYPLLLVLVSPWDSRFGLHRRLALIMPSYLLISSPLLLHHCQRWWRYRWLLISLFAFIGSWLLLDACRVFGFRVFLGGIFCKIITISPQNSKHPNTNTPVSNTPGTILMCHHHVP